MNQDMLSGNWNQLRGKLRTWWGKLSDDDFEWISGQKDRLVGLIQEKYGYTRDQAEQDIYRCLSEYGADDMKAKAYAFGETAANRARGAFSSVADTVDSASSYLRDNEWETMAADLRDIIRKYPWQSILLGAGLIYWIARQRR
jgi:uncharacterized protein YjbJ (UPF0337 family)